MFNGVWVVGYFSLGNCKNTPANIPYRTKFRRTKVLCAEKFIRQKFCWIIHFRQTKLPKIEVGAENFVRRKKLVRRKFVR